MTMTDERQVHTAYEEARKRYEELGVDTEEAMRKLDGIRLSMHCWQGDDVHGFINPEVDLADGLTVSGNYSGRARTPDELTDDLHEAMGIIPGKKNVALHTIYAVTDRKKDLDEIGPEDFKYWVDWAKNENVGLDMNGTFFSHPMVKNNFTLASPEKEVRDFWIEVGRQSRRIANYFGSELGQQSVNNFWIPDGYKDNPIDKLSPRQRLIESLDSILEEEFPESNTIEAYEGKLFGTGIESYTVGSHEFYANYALTRGKLWTIDAGHFHPTEDVSDKFSAFLAFGKGLQLHVSRPVRWDSDHVVIMDDALARITRSLVRDDLLDRTNVGLDFFDATINRIAAWVIGARTTQKAFLQALLTPVEDLKHAEEKYDFTKRLAVTEELKSYPFGAVFDEYCLRNNVPVGTDWLNEVVRYERNVQLKRN